jgi:uncharacterized protein involved in exopolysaccharide biosynthesis
LSFVLRNWKRVLAFPALLALLVTAIILLLPRHYSAHASFTPQSEGADLSQVAGLAAQFGFTLPTVTPEESVDFYVALLDSRSILGAAVRSEYVLDSDPGATDTVTLVELWGDGLLGLRRQSEAEREDRAIDELRERLHRRADAATGIVRFSVETLSSDLSRKVAERLLDLVEDFNIRVRQTRGGAERDFLVERVEAAQLELTLVEDELADFIERNRSYENSPELTFQYNRLQESVNLQREVNRTLVEALETAKIDEVRNTPVITIVEEPELPVRPDSRRLVLKALMWFVLAVLLGSLVSVGAEFLERARRSEPAEYERLRSSMRTAGGELRGWISRLGRRRR